MTIQDLVNRTYHIGLFYNNPQSPYSIGVGRLYVPWATSLSTIDGGYFARRFGRRARLLELSKENLLSFWNTVLQRADFQPRTQEAVEHIQKDADGLFTVRTQKAQYRACTIVLAMGRAGIPRKLGVKGEDLPKVMYRLIAADHYINKNILVVGGGDSAVEAAMGLANQKGNAVTLSYRQGSFGRIKERNAARIEECLRLGRVNVVWNSKPVEFGQDSVTLDVAGVLQEIPNDYVWIFAGGIPPNDFLKSINIRFGTIDMTLEASREAKQAASREGVPDAAHGSDASGHS